jgi:hypothetical protein
MKTLLVLILVIATTSLFAASRDLIQFVPELSFSVIGADFDTLRDNDVFLSMQSKGQIWSYEDDSDIVNYFRLLNIDPKKDIRTFVVAKYLNSYGAAGKIHVLELTRNVAPSLAEKSSTKYLGASLHRVDPEQDRYAAMLNTSAVALGKLNEVKMALDLSLGKVSNMSKNSQLRSMFDKVPAQAAVWGIAAPLTRRKAADSRADQSTNAMLQAFQHYYFYGVPTKTSANSHFYGIAKDDNEAAVVTAFMIGTLTVAKFRAEEQLADMLDRVDIDHQGRAVHVSAVVTKEMVDAFYNGDLGF